MRRGKTKIIKATAKKLKVKCIDLKSFDEKIPIVEALEHAATMLVFVIPVVALWILLFKLL